MTIMDRELAEWLNNDIPMDAPLELKEGAPERVREKFEEWKKQKTEEEAQGIWA